MAIATVNPANGQTVQTFKALTAAEIETKLSLAWRTFLEYRKTPYGERAQKLLAAAHILGDESERLGRIMTTEMGKTLKSAIAEAQKCALGCRYYAENGEKQLADEVIETNASRSLVRYQPLGPILAVMPWNFPFWQVLRFAAPTLMAGNVALLKHSSNVPQCALAIEDILLRAGFPAGAFQTLLIDSNQVEAILNDERVLAASLTGSEPAGQSVASIAGKQIKKTVLELGGSDPFVVMPSTDVKATAAAAVGARVINNGQSCIAAKRFIVAESVYDEFVKEFADRMQRLVVGDPTKPETEVGPLATAKIRDDLHEQVERAVADGGKVLTGGKKIDGEGYYYQPTILTDVPKTSRVFREEFFGPVAMVFRAKDIGHAIELANDTPFGLGSSVWSNDEAEIEQLTNGIEAGQVFVNSPVVSDPRLPFGGIKRSGYGRELSTAGIREFVNAKTIWRK
jgi:succinate-semialdehyde dehydrogenase / glutarate-semialdehyde dehydrogenase